MYCGPLREQRDRQRQALILALLAALSLASLGCATPKTIDGRPVIGTRWVDGKVVYVLGETEADRQRLQEGAREAEVAGKDVVFKPLK